MATTTNDLNGLFKECYGSELINLIPESALLVKDIAFSAKDKQMGGKFHQPVIVAQEHGVTYAEADAGAFDLNAAISMQTKDASVAGAQMLLRSSLSYDAASRASAGKESFGDATQTQIENMMTSITKRLELSLLYGGNATGLGTVTSVASGTATTCTLTFEAAGFAAGIWGGTENAKIDIFKVSDSTKVNTAGALVITTVDTTARTMVVTGASADITAVVAMGTTDQFVRWYGAAGKEMVGIDRIITNTGELFGINAATYNLWKGSTYAVGGALTLAKLQAAMALSVERGGLDEGVKVYVNPKTWANLLTEQTALRQFDSSYSSSTVESGSKAIKFYGQTGTMEIVAHPYVKEGEAFVLPIKRIRRVGSQDISFDIPGSTKGEIFRQLENSAGFEYRLYTNQAIIAETPAKLTKLTGIVNS